VPVPQLTDFEQLLLGLICMAPSSGYDLKRAFSTTPLGVYQPSSGALYPALARLVGKGLVQPQAPAGPAEPGRRRVVYEATPSGRATNITWIRAPVAPVSVSRDLGLHLMRFVMMEALLSRDEVLWWLQGLMDALSIFVADVERHRAAMLAGPVHALLALDHGIAVHQASLAWAQATWHKISQVALGDGGQDHVSAGSEDEGHEWSVAFATASTDGMEAYNDALVRPVFSPWGEYLLEALAVASGERLLDVATGPGTVARLASGRLGPSGHVLAIDLSAAMLVIAEAKGPVAHGSPIEYRLGPAAPLAVPGSSFDVACCQQGLQFFPDRPAALAEMRRALRPGGRIGLAVWASVETCPPFAALRDAIGEVMGHEAAERYARGPWGFHEPRALADMVTAAGFAEVFVDEIARPVRFEAGVAQLDRSLAASGLATEIGALRPDMRAALASAVADKLRSLTDGSGAISSYLTSQIVLAVAR
jgi:ubiquinone/menaquinone biosynthesis C-methylase UbiE/DNA-binding PadR family transcriptional regulator